MGVIILYYVVLGTSSLIKQKQPTTIGAEVLIRQLQHLIFCLFLTANVHEMTFLFLSDKRTA
jgi:hypothetical protein